jgi:hypothetical protein
MDEIEGYKLFRRLSDGQLHPLFINKSMVIPAGVWLLAESHPTKGFAVRPGWHATLSPAAPHLKMRLASGEQREWVRVLLRGVTFYNRPESQGGTWVLARELKVIA